MRRTLHRSCGRKGVSKREADDQPDNAYDEEQCAYIKVIVH